MLAKNISGGESGANRAGWRIAKAFAVDTGGWMRGGFLTDDGRHPEFAHQFAAAELPIESEAARTEQNVRDSDATIWFGNTTTLGAQTTVKACLTFGKPVMPVYPGASFDPSHVAQWIADNKIEVLHVAGNRETEEPAIGDWVERFLGDVLERLGHQRS
jgi:hypothetical protein